jgi:hypothetical protein
MRGIKILVIGTLFAVSQPSFSQSSYSVGLNFQYNKGGYGAYPIGAYPMNGYGYGNFGQINQCMNSQYMMSAANAYGPGYGPGGPGYGPGGPGAYGPGMGKTSDAHHASASGDCSTDALHDEPTNGEPIVHAKRPLWWRMRNASSSLQHGLWWRSIKRGIWSRLRRTIRWKRRLLRCWWPSHHR